MPTARLDADHSALLVIDLQEKLVPHMRDVPGLLESAGRLIDGFQAMGLPVLATEQYRKGLGPTVPPIAERLASAQDVFEKVRFSACIDPVRQRLANLGVRSVVLAGIEAHVCVLQTALDLIDAGLVTAVAVDAVSSRRSSDEEAARQRLVEAGALPTTVESVLFELAVEAGTDRFRRILELVK